METECTEADPGTREAGVCVRILKKANKTTWGGG